MTLASAFPGKIGRVFGSRGGLALPRAGLIFYAKAPGLVDSIGLSDITLTTGTPADLMAASWAFPATTVMQDIDTLEGGGVLFDGDGTPIIRFGYQWYTILNSAFLWVGPKGLAGYSTNQIANYSRIMQVLETMTVSVDRPVHKNLFTDRILSDPTKWVVAAGISVGGGEITFSATPDGNYLSQNSIDKFGSSHRYLFVVEVSAISSGALKLWVGGYSHQLPATAAVHYHLTNSGAAGWAGIQAIGITTATIKRFEIYPVSPSIGSVTCVGDSITYTGYASYLRSTLANTIVYNQGVGGNTTADIIARMSTILIDRAKICCLLLGTNDLSSGVTLATLKANILQIISTLHDEGTSCVISTLCPRGGSAGWTAGEQLLLEEFNAWVKTLSGSGIKTVDSYAALEDPGNPGAMLPTYDSGDHLHPNNAGYGIIAETFEPALLSYYVGIP